MARTDTHPLLSVMARHRNGKTPLILQSEAAECGLACLSMIAHYHNKRISLAELRRNYGLSLRGATLKQIMDVSAALGLTPRALKLELGDVRQLQLPCILHWNMQHFVVLTRVTAQGMVLHDPALGYREIRWQQADNQFTGVALELIPGPAFQPQAATPSLRLRDFWCRAQGLKRSLTLLFVLSALLQLFAIASPYYMQIVIDDVLLRQHKDLLLVLALGFGLLLAIEVATSVLRRLLILNFSSHLHLQMASNVFQHLIHLPVSYFARRHIGDVVSRFSSLNHIRELLTVGVVTAFIDGLMALITLVVMVVYSPTLALIVALVVVLYLLLRLALIPTMKRLSAERITEMAKEQSHFMESVRAIQTVKQLNQETSRQSQWQNHLAATLNCDIRLGKWDIGTFSANQVLFGVENLLVIYFAALQVMDNAMTVGMLYAFMSYKNRFVNAMDNLVTQAVEFKMLAVHFDRLSDIVHTEAEPAPASDIAPGSMDKPELQLVNLSYRYGPLEKDIFQGLNLTVPSGAIIAIVGPSGSGKSTLLKCMMGLLQPSQGEVRFGGSRISQQRGFRRMCASVLQDDHCLAGSIAENICSFDEQPDPARMVQAARMACLHQEIITMPMQYQTLVGDMGSTLSGGQLQRLLLARALYRQPRVLFLDEASSHLDIDNESAINANLQQLPLTRIIVAHRPQTIAIAHQVYLLEGGQLSDVTSSIPQPQPTPAPNTGTL